MKRRLTRVQRYEALLPMRRIKKMPRLLAHACDLDPDLEEVDLG
jgi:hypothetical protein